MIGWFKDICFVLNNGLASERPVMDPDISDILDDDELRDKYLDRVDNSTGGVVDVSDIIEELHKKRNLPKIREDKINSILK